MMNKVRMYGVAAIATAALVMTGCAPQGGGGGDASDVPMDTVIDRFGVITDTLGPNGETATRISELELTDEEKTQLREGGYRAAVLWHELSAWTLVVQSQIEAVFDDLGIEMVATADAKLDPATQANQILSSLALEPDVLLALPADPATDAPAFQVAVDDGAKLIFAEQAPVGFTYGEEYQSIITDDLYEMAKSAAAAMCDAVDGKGEIGMIYWDIEYHATNFKDAVFQQEIKNQCPDVTIVAKNGFSDPSASEEVANAMIARNPDLAGIYVSWVSPAQGVLAALRSAGNESTKIVTYDLDDTMSTDMASDGNTAAIMVGDANQYGQGMALAAAYAILGKSSPAFAVVNPVLVTKNTIAEGYQAWGQDVPAAVQEALDSH